MRSSDLGLGAGVMSIMAVNRRDRERALKDFHYENAYFWYHFASVTGKVESVLAGSAKDYEHNWRFGDFLQKLHIRTRLSRDPKDIKMVIKVAQTVQSFKKKMDKVAAKSARKTFLEEQMDHELRCMTHDMADADICVDVEIMGHNQLLTSECQSTSFDNISLDQEDLSDDMDGESFKQRMYGMSKTQFSHHLSRRERESNTVPIFGAASPRPLQQDTD
eukprot:gene11076-14072_t